MILYLPYALFDASYMPTKQVINNSTIGSTLSINISRILVLTSRFSFMFYSPYVIYYNNELQNNSVNKNHFMYHNIYMK